MNIDSIIAEWTYRLEKGYPDCPEDYIELRNVLREQTDLPIDEQDAIVRRAMGLEETVNISGNEFANLLDTLSIDSSKLIQVQELAKYTKQYTDFGNQINETSFSYDFGEYDSENNNYFGVDMNMNLSDICEYLILKLIETKSDIPMIWFVGQQRGVDGRSKDGKYLFEIKAAQKPSPNINLQTTFFTADTDNTEKYYIFIYHNNDRTNLKFNNINIVSSELLRKISLGEKIYSELQSGYSETLKDQLQSGLANFNFQDQIVAALTTGDTSEYQKSFKIGNNIGVRFKIEFYSTKFRSASNGINEEEGYEI